MEFRTNFPSDLFNSFDTYYIKFIYSEKATKFFEISTVHLTFPTWDKYTVEISQNFVVFSEDMNFTYMFQWTISIWKYIFVERHRIYSKKVTTIWQNWKVKLKSNFWVLLGKPGLWGRKTQIEILKLQIWNPASVRHNLCPEKK